MICIQAYGRITDHIINRDREDGRVEVRTLCQSHGGQSRIVLMLLDPTRIGSLEPYLSPGQKVFFSGGLLGEQGTSILLIEVDRLQLAGRLASPGDEG